MRLAPVRPGRGLRLLCCACGAWTTDHDTFYDQAGTPFTDFYCGPCARAAINNHAEGEYRHRLWLSMEEECEKASTSSRT